jgi:hypothetical protein
VGPLPLDDDRSLQLFPFSMSQNTVDRSIHRKLSGSED